MANPDTERTNERLQEDLFILLQSPTYLPYFMPEEKETETKDKQAELNRRQTHRKTDVKIIKTLRHKDLKTDKQNSS